MGGVSDAFILLLNKFGAIQNRAVSQLKIADIGSI